MSKTVSPSIALVYDRVNTPHGGAENVLLALHQAFPTAPLFTALYHPKTTAWAQQFPAVYPSFLNKLPLLRSLHRWLAWLMPLAFESFDLKAFDIVISVTSAEAKGIITHPHQLHLCYLLTPPRYLYQDREHSLASHWLLRLPLVHQLAQLWLNYLTWWDQAAIFRPDGVIPISRRVANRIKQYYPALKSRPVIYPPVDVITTQTTLPHPFQGQSYFLSISRLVSHKHLDLAIKACARLKQNLVIVGEGPELARLQRIAAATADQHQVVFLSSVDNQQLQALYTHCQALLMPGEEDFGIVALEANAFGKPVIINQNSGAAELIKPSVHGIYLADGTVEAVVTALQKFNQTQFFTHTLRQNSLKYGTNNFIRAFVSTVKEAWKTYQTKYDQ